MNIHEKMVAEFIGTAIFTLGALSAGAAWMVGVVLVASIMIVGHKSGGHLNPAISTAKYLQKEIDSTQLICYISAQIAGAIVGYTVYLALNKNNKMKKLSHSCVAGDITCNNPLLQQ